MSALWLTMSKRILTDMYRKPQALRGTTRSFASAMPFSGIHPMTTRRVVLSKPLMGRYYSTPTTSSNLPPPTPETLTDVAAVSTSVGDMVPDADLWEGGLSVAQSIIPPMQYGDLASLGLVNWWPSGIISWSLELVNVSTGMPWFWTVVVTSIMWRLAFVPLHISAMRSTAKLHIVMPQVTPYVDAARAAYANGDMITANTASQKAASIMKANNVSNFGPHITGPLIQVPFAFGNFFALKHMCELPVLQMTQSGVSFLPNLAACGDVWWLPLLAITLFQGQFKISMNDMPPSTTRTGWQLHLPNFLRAMSLVTYPILTNLPDGLLLALCVTSACMSLQSLVLSIPTIRQKFDLPPRQKSTAPTVKETYQFTLNYVQEFYKNSSKNSRR